MLKEVFPHVNPRTALIDVFGFWVKWQNRELNGQGSGNVLSLGRGHVHTERQNLDGGWTSITLERTEGVRVHIWGLPVLGVMVQILIYAIYEKKSDIRKRSTNG